LKNLVSYSGTKINEFWFLKVMMMDYNIPLVIKDSQYLLTVLKFILEHDKEDWHVIVSGLNLISKVLEFNQNQNPELLF
jgi:hypothetical protein